MGRKARQAKPPHRLIVLEEVGSTNTWLKENPEFQRPFTGIRAIRQTAGRGRLARTWFSGKGDDLTCSFIVPVMRLAGHIAPLVAGMALYRVVSRECAVKIKWPNDLLFQGKKLAGILCESLPGVEHLVIVGIGLNINSREFPEAVDSTATSLSLATGKNHSPQKFWLLIYRELVRAFRQFSNPLDAQFLNAYNAAAYRYVRRAEISDAPLEFKTLLADGRACFSGDAGREIILDMPE